MGPSEKRGNDFITAAHCAHKALGSTSSTDQIAARMPLAAVPSARISNSGPLSTESPATDSSPRLWFESYSSGTPKEKHRKTRNNKAKQRRTKKNKEEQGKAKKNKEPQRGTPHVKKTTQNRTHKELLLVGPRFRLSVQFVCFCFVPNASFLGSLLRFFFVPPPGRRVSLLTRCQLTVFLGMRFNKVHGNRGCGENGHHDSPCLLSP